MLSHIQNKCDSMLILLSVSHSTTYHHVAFHGYLTINRAIAFRDTPFEGNPYCVHRGHSFPVGNKSLHTFKGGYIVGILIGATLFQGRGVTIYRVRIISVSFEEYGYLPISLNGRIMRRSLSVTFIGTMEC